MIAREAPEGSISSARSEASARWRGAAIDSMNRQAVLPSEAPTNSQENGRAPLRQAQTALVEAESGRDAAAKVLASAQLELSAVDRELGVLRQSAEEIAGARAKQITAALKGGARPKVEADERVARNAVRTAELDGERMSWTRAVNELAAEARAAGEAVQRAREGVNEAVRGVLIAEANSLAEQAERHAATALKLRTRIGPIMGPVDGQGISAATMRALQSNRGIVWNSPEDLALRASTVVWNLFAAELAHNADARPAFEL
jgi:hypothetical protein